MLKFKISAPQKTLSRELEEKLQTRRKYLQEIHLIKVYYLKIFYEGLLKLKNKISTHFKNEPYIQNIHLTKEDTKMANNHMKRHFTSYVIREMQTKTTRYHYTTLNG